jgi:hypothetical protein
VRLLTLMMAFDERSLSCGNASSTSSPSRCASAHELLVMVTACLDHVEGGVALLADGISMRATHAALAPHELLVVNTLVMLPAWRACACVTTSRVPTDWPVLVQAEKVTVKTAELQHVNSVLKRAVAMQHSRMTKMSAEHSAALHEAKAQLDTCQARCQSLEAANYALNLHLKQAVSGQANVDGRPPDVF